MKYSQVSTSGMGLTNTIEKKERFLYLDFLKFAATFFVLSYHFSLYSYDFIESASILNYIHYYYRTILSMCVPLFFFINGYLLFEKELILRNHINKTLRYIGLVFVWSSLYVLIVLLLSNRSYSKDDVISAFLNMDPSFGINILWYLGALVSIYILFPALKALYDSSNSGFLWFTICCAILTIGFGFANDVIAFWEVIIHRFLPNNRMKLYTFDNIIFEMFNPFNGGYGYSFVYFCVGGLVRQNLNKILVIHSAKRNVAAIVCMIISCTLLFLQGVFYSRYIEKEVWRIVWNGYDTVFTFINIMSLFILSLNYKKNIRFIRAVSQHTLGIYFVHILLGGVLVAVFSRVISFAYVWQNLLFTFFLLFVCLGCCTMLKRIPIVKHLI